MSRRVQLMSPARGFERVLLLILILGSQPLSAELVKSTDPVQELKLCQDVWPPYTFGEELQAPTHGIAVELVNEISARISTPISIQLLPWKRCLRLAELGKVDGIALLTINQERQTFLEFTNYIISDNNLVWYRADRALGKEWSSFEELRDLRIGVVAGFNYGDEFNNARSAHSLKVEDALTVLDNFKKLALGRIDIFFVNLPVANDALKGHPELKNQFTYVDKLFEKVPFAIGFSKRSEAMPLLEKVNLSIEQMKQDGTIDRIMQK